MSDRSSESSCEWVLLTDDDNEQALVEDETRPSNLDVSYDSVCLAASASINSSLTNEDLEWEHERLADFDLLAHHFSRIEEIDQDVPHEDFNGDSNVGETDDIDISSCVFSEDFKEDVDINIASVQKSHCYKHDRNEHLNYILNIMLALVVSSAIGLGAGHFLGWSHKCWRNLSELKDATPDPIIPMEAVIRHDMETLVSKEKEEFIISSLPESLTEIHDLPSETGTNYVYQATCKENSNNNVIFDITAETNIFTKTSSLNNADVSDVSVSNNISQRNFSDSKNLITKNMLPEIDWNTVSELIVSGESTSEHISIPNKNTVLVKTDNEHLLHSVKSIGSVLSDFEKVFVSDVTEGSNKGKDYYEQSHSSNQLGSDNLNNENNFTTQLREDLIQVVQTLNAFVLSQLSNSNEKFISLQDLEIVVNLYQDLHNIIDMRTSFINEFVHSEEYKMYPKLGLKYLQKMVYSLVDSFDRVMKMSMKTFGKNRKVNAFKLSKNMSKIIFNFDKKWERNKKIWSENLEKTKVKRKSFYKMKNNFFEKESKQWKKKNTKERDFKNFKNKRYSMKS